MARGGSPGRTSRRASAPYSRSRNAPSSGARSMVDHAARRPAPARAPQPQGGEASGCGDNGRPLRPDQRDGGAVRHQGQSGARRGARRRGRHGVGTDPDVLRGGVGGGSAGAPGPPGRAGAANGRSPRCERRRRLPRGRLRELNRRRGGVDPEALRRDEEVAARDSGRARVWTPSDCVVDVLRLGPALRTG
jgi:hypothetical protein